ncbi:hypothetical protein Hanom_Chr06g00547721 [Helianthus anomalus]
MYFVIYFLVELPTVIQIHKTIFLPHHVFSYTLTLYTSVSNLRSTTACPPPPNPSSPSSPTSDQPPSIHLQIRI